MKASNYRGFFYLEAVPAVRCNLFPSAALQAKELLRQFGL
jgi:hypothetical protein